MHPHDRRRSADAADAARSHTRRRVHETLLEPGEILGDRFEIVEEAGAGGVGVVFRARDKWLGRDVAIKVLHVQSGGVAERFVRETSVLAELVHLAIVRFVARGVTRSGRIYLATEWLEGEDLASRLSRGALGIEPSVALARRAADALGVVHARGVVHRDLKPGNLFLPGGDTEAVKLLDFGAVLDASALEQEDDAIGTPGYMAPEQARGDADVDARADVFALGCVLFECITGEPAFAGRGAVATVARILLEEAPRLRDRHPSVPAALDELVARCLAKEREARPADGAALAASLGALGLDDSASSSGLRSGRDREATRTLLGRATRFVGRDDELASLRALFDSCVAEQRAASVLVTAPAGGGKSRLGAELVRAIHQRGDRPSVWSAQGDAMTAGSAYGLASQIVRRTAGLKDGAPPSEQWRRLVERVARRVPDADVARVAEFLGEMAGAPSGEEASVPLRAARGDAMLMGDQIRRAWEDFIAAECAAGPLVIVLDDLQWGDLPSIRLVSSALSTLAQRRLFVIALARPEAPALLDTFASGAARRIALEALPRDAARALAAAALGEGSLVDRVVDRAKGNPFHLEELIRSTASGAADVLPESVLATVEARLASMSPDARRVARAASVFGPAFWAGGVASLLRRWGGGESRDQQLEPALGELERLEVIAPRLGARFQGETEYAFGHALLAEAASAMLSGDDRRAGHVAAAEWLEAAGETDAARLAEHFERGGEAGRAARLYLRAAEQALDGNDLDVALGRAHRGKRAYAEGGGDAELAGRFAVVEAQAHRWRDENADAEQCAAEAMPLLRRASPAWCAALTELAVTTLRLGHIDALQEASIEVTGLLADPGARAEVIVAAARTALSLLFAGRYRRASVLLDACERALPGLSAADAALASTWVTRGRAQEALASGNPAAFLDLKMATARAFDTAGDARNACSERTSTGCAYNELGCYEDAERVLREALAIAERLGLGTVATHARHVLGLTLARLGRLSEAYEVELAAVSALRAQRGAKLDGGALIYLAMISAMLGELDRAEVEARESAKKSGAGRPWRAHALATYASVLLARARPVEALAAAREAHAILLSFGSMEDGESFVRLLYAEALHATGEHPAARDAIAEARARLLARAERIGDAALAKSFLERIPEHTRTLALAEQWLA